jgi:transcriptional regulator with XRE-family HTH domain
MSGRQAKKQRGPVWEGGQVRALRRHLGLSQRGLADELGTRQQTISEWETGQYRPRGASARLLTLVAERAGFQYEVGRRSEGQEETAWTGEGQGSGVKGSRGRV